jgi:valyl-tRNA synthetase
VEHRRFLLTSVGTDRVTPLDRSRPSGSRAPTGGSSAASSQATAECDRALGPARPGAGGTWTDAERTAGLRLNEYAEVARRFVWYELADWYVEHSKGRVAGPTATPEDREVARAVLVHAFDHALRLLHPIVPFLTEALWQRLPGRGAGEFITRATWPAVMPVDEHAAREFAQLQQVVEAIRSVRADYAVAPGKALEATVVAPADAPVRAVLAERGGLRRPRGAHDRRRGRRGARRRGRAGGARRRGDARHAARRHGGPGQGARQAGEGARAARPAARRAARPAVQRRASPRVRPAAVVEGEREKEREWSARREQLAAKVAALGAA